MSAGFMINTYDSPLIATAIHDGHDVHHAVLPYMKLQEYDRFREEDPYTALMADLPVNQVVVQVSRFQTDLNRPREKAIYLRPEDAWGLQVWNQRVPDTVKELSYRFYDDFYEAMHRLISGLVRKYGRFIVLDIHSYNHRRESPQQAASVEDNPEINIGTGHNHREWNALSERFIRFLSHTTINGNRPDVRENIKFRGGGFAQWVNTHFGNYGCVLSVEWKKTFMDEWTGRLYPAHLADIRQALLASLPCLLDELEQINTESND
jgi:N-formylglutamate deformylase